MHKNIYASGFLYHPPTQQILLHQSNNSSSYWSLFSGEKKGSDDPKKVFQDVIHKHLRIKLLPKTICLVYDYTDTNLNKTHFILYAEVDRLHSKFKLKKNHAVGWFTFKQLNKLSLADQVKHDITVSQRVVDAAVRALEPQEVNLFDKS